MKKILTALFVVFITLSSFSNVKAEENILGYSIDIEDISDEIVKNHIHSLEILKNGDLYDVVVNNNNLGSCDGTGTFTYSPNSTYKFFIAVDTNQQKVSFSYKKTTEENKTIKAVFRFRKSNYSEDIKQYVDVYPNYDNDSYCRTLYAEYVNGEACMGGFTYSYDGKSYSFEEITVKNNRAYITVNGEEHQLVLDGSGTMEITLFIETWVDEQPLEMDYMDGPLDKVNFSRAQTIYYGKDKVNEAVNRKPITLKNNATGQSAPSRVVYEIRVWDRVNTGAAIGDGIYDTQTPYRTVQVVCEWADDVCASIREKYGEAGRLYAVYQTNYTYTGYTTQTATRMKMVSKTSEPTSSWPSNADTAESVQYRYADYTYPSDWTWSEEAWPSYACSDGSCKHTTQTKYRYRTASWQAWGNWVPEDLTRDYEDAGLAWQREERTAYAKSTASWESWGDWGTTNRTAACDSDEDCDYESRIKYAYRTLTNSSSSYTTDSSEKDDCEDQFECSWSVDSYQKRTRTAYPYKYRTRTCSRVTKYDKQTGTASFSSCSGSSCSGFYSGSKPSDTDTYRYRNAYEYKCYKSTDKTMLVAGATRYSTSSVSTGGSNTSICTSTYPKVGKKTSGYQRTTVSWGSKTEVSSCSTQTSYTKCTSKQVTSCGSWSGYTNTTSCSETTYSQDTSYKTKECVSQSGVYSGWSDWSTVSSKGSNSSTTEYRTRWKLTTKSWTSYSSYGNPSTVCTDLGYTSQTCQTAAQYQYRYRSKVWSSYSGYDYTSCTANSTTKCKSIQQYRFRIHDYSAWSDYIYNSNPCNSMSLPSDVSCYNSSKDMHGYKVGSLGSYSAWYNTTSAKSYVEGRKYQYRTTYKELDKYTAEYPVFPKQAIQPQPEMTKTAITNFANNLNRNLAYSSLLYNAYRSLGEQSKDAVTNSELINYVNSHQAEFNEELRDTTANELFLGENIFVPYVYIRGHLRADDRKFEIEGVDGVTKSSVIDTYKKTNTSPETPAGNEPLKPIYDPNSTRETKVIYFDYNGPLANYDDVPDEVQEAIDMIKGTNLSETQISITLKADDLKKIKEYLEEHNGVSDNCDMLYKFSYIFDEVTQHLIASEGCKVEDDD